MFNQSPIENLYNDPEITEIMVNGIEPIYIEKRGKLQQTDVRFESEAQLLQFIQELVQSVGRYIDEMNPLAHIGLPDGSQVTALLQAVVINGPSLTIRKAINRAISWEDLVNYGSVTPKMVELLEAIMKAKLNVVVAGGTQSGKTTIINALSEFIPHDERLVTVEHLHELQLRHPHVVRLVPRGADNDGKGEVTVRDLMITATMMRADRFLMAEVRGTEVWDMLQAMSSGHEGSLFGIHATSIHDVLERLEMMATAATNLPLLQIRAKMAQSVQVIIQQMRLADGKRKIVTIAEVVGFKNNVIELGDIVRLEGNELRFTGYVPSFAQRLGLGEDFFKS